MRPDRINRWMIPLTILLSLLFVIFGNKLITHDNPIFETVESAPVVKGEVTEIIGVYEDENEFTGEKIKEIAFRVTSEENPNKGEDLVAIQTISEALAISPKDVEVGDKVLLYNFHNEDFNTDWVFEEYVRTGPLMILGLIFFLLLILFGRSKGFRTLVTLVLTLLGIFFVYIPAILNGWNIYGSTLAIVVYMTLMTLIIVSGGNRKTTAAVVGCLGGIGVAALLVLIMDGALKLTGIVNDESVFLMMINPENPIDLKGVFFGAIIIGAMGAIMDVAMSISSALHEISEQVAGITPSKLFSSGMTIGRDIMGTMSNTLILAYIGSSLSVVLLLITYNPTLMNLMNKEFVVVEVLQALAGSMGILLTIPLTSIASSILYKRKHNEEAV